MSFTFCLTILIFGTVNIYAYSDDIFEDIEINSINGFYTIITDTEGVEHKYNGVINTKTIENNNSVEKIASYKVCSDNEEIINVNLNDIMSKENVNLSGADGTTAINGY